MHRSRSLWFGLIALAVIGAASIALAHRGGESEANDPDRDAAAHVPSQPGYRSHNAVRTLATAPATGWSGEAKLAVEDTWEPYIVADPATPYVYAMYNRYGACTKG